MLKNCFLFFLAFFFIFCTGCEEEDALKPRRKGQTGGAVTENTFIGSYTADSGSAPPCPNGPGAEIEIDFVNVQMDVKVPEMDMSSNFSPELAAANLALQPVETPSLNNQTGSFTGTFVIQDAAGDFDTDACLNAGDSYASQIRLTITGSVLSGVTIQGATYGITNVCNSGSPTDPICSGSFSGSQTN